ncbi:MAG: class I SAM-dependent methyltransferase [Myxococcota bacterium]
MEPRQHWDDVYTKKAVDGVSWYRPHLERSLAFIEAAGLTHDAAILDVGGGASTLVDDLVQRGYRRVTVLDLAQSAIDAAKLRLGAAAANVIWRVDDIIRADLAPSSVDLWHDRAVFHFLTDPADRARYVEQVARAVRPGGHVIVATFAPDGPERCSGLEVVRYDADRLHAAFGDRFVKVASEAETHVTPWGSEQSFTYCYCRIAPAELASAPT